MYQALSTFKALTSLNIHNNSMKSGQFSHFQNEKETNPERWSKLSKAKQPVRDRAGI